MEKKNPLCGLDEDPDAWLCGGHAALNFVLDELGDEAEDAVDRVRRQLEQLAGG